MKVCNYCFEYIEGGVTKEADKTLYFCSMKCLEQHENMETTYEKLKTEFK